MSTQATDHRNPGDSPSIIVEDLTKKFGHGILANLVLDSVSFTVDQGTSVGLVGESGSGKSTIAKIVCGMYKSDSGRLTVAGTDIAPGQRFPAEVQKAVSFISQNPFSSFNPRLTIGQSLVEAISPLSTQPGRHRQTIVEWLERVGLPADSAGRYPHEFSGGQRQRLAIARGLIRRPSVVVADEITSALDMSVQVQILSLLAELRREYSFSMLFISHNLSVVRNVCDEVMVMQSGAIVERGASEQILTAPTHPYTQRLLASIPGSPGFSLVD
ncbi:ABC transporter ATP-binding protein [Brevibacterium yomogidense]|uniref:ABC transporter ATP-binding protein n=1 Tax=Brevibacterium yomogidense TaxID=946573 RepID=UPI0018DF04D9|nr:ABC transporter ATP-binding protein [Brevibacterium yomogidense]